MSFQGKMYSILMDAQVISAAKDLISITVPANKVVILHEVVVTQEGGETSDTAVMQIHRGTGTSGAGTATTPRALDEGNGDAFGGTVLTDLGTDEDEGVILARRSFNLLTPFHYLPTPAGLISATGAGILVIRSDIAITSNTLTCEAIVELIG